MNTILNETFIEFAKAYYKELNNGDGTITYDFITSSDVYHLESMYIKALKKADKYFSFNNDIYLNQVLEKIQLINNENFKVMMEREKEDSRFSSIFKNQSSFIFVKDYRTQPELNSLSRYLNLIKFKDKSIQGSIFGTVFLFSEKDVYERFLIDEQVKLEKIYKNKSYMLIDEDDTVVGQGLIEDLSFEDFGLYDVLVEVPNLFDFSRYTNQSLMALSLLSYKKDWSDEHLQKMIAKNIDKIIAFNNKNISISIFGSVLINKIKESDYYDIITLNEKESPSSFLKNLFYKEDNDLFKRELEKEFVIEDVNDYFKDLNIPFKLDYKDILMNESDVRMNVKVKDKSVF